MVVYKEISIFKWKSCLTEAVVAWLLTGFSLIIQKDKQPLRVLWAGCMGWMNESLESFCYYCLTTNMRKEIHSDKCSTYNAVASKKRQQYCHHQHKRHHNHLLKYIPISIYKCVLHV